MTNRIEGYFRTLSPVHQTKPGVTGYVTRRGDDGRLRVSFVKSDAGECHVQMTTPLFTEAGDRTDIPIVTGNSMRGVLRRHASRLLFRRLGQPVRPELFQCVTVGSYHRRDMGAAKTADMVNSAAKHVFVGLFGGGGAGLSSGYSCGDLVPILPSTQYLMPPWVRDVAQIGSTSVHDLTEVYATIRRDPLLDGEGVQFVHDHDRVYADRIQRSANAASAKDDALNLRMISYVQAIVPGITLSVSIGFRAHMRDHQVGLLLLALQDLVNEQRLAGASRRGFGRFEPHLRLFHDGLEGSLPLFEPVLLDGSIESYKLSSDALRFVEAADASLDKLSIAELEDLLITTVPRSAKEKGRGSSAERAD